jgi:hypothetical protein
LNSFIISNTGFNDVRNLEKGKSQADFENHHVFFQDDGNYIEKMMKRIK